MGDDDTNDLPDTRGGDFPDYMLHGDAVLADKARWRGGKVRPGPRANCCAQRCMCGLLQYWA